MASWKRARTADRDAAVDLINAAFVDGQLTHAERDDKVSRALVARTVGDLQQTTADLQGGATASGQSPRSGAAARGWRQVRAWWQARSITGRLALAAVALGIVGASVAALDQSEPEPPAAQGSTYRIDVNAEAVADLVEDYRSAFGTTRSYGLVVHRDWVRVRVPLTGDRTRHEEWTLVADGEFSRSEEARGAGDLRELDLADLDTDALAESVDRARTGLGVEDVIRTEIIVERWSPDDEARVVINVANDYDEGGHLITDLAGRVVTEEPHVAP